jgi:hypothetical protein
VGIAGLAGIDGLIRIGRSFIDSTPLASNTITAGISKATTFPVALDTVDQKVKKGDDKKAAAVCK